MRTLKGKDIKRLMEGQPVPGLTINPLPLNQGNQWDTWEVKSDIPLIIEKVDNVYAHPAVSFSAQTAVMAGYLVTGSGDYALISLSLSPRFHPLVDNNPAS